MDELARPLHFEEVDSWLEAVGRTEWLADHEMSRCHVQTYAVLERWIRLVVQIDADLVLMEEGA